MLQVLTCSPFLYTAKLYSTDLSSGLWSELRAPNAPTLSHHAGLVIEDRYLLLVGGWNGQRRDTNVYVYDAQVRELRPPFNKKSFRVYRPGGSKRADWNFFFHLFKKKKILLSPLYILVFKQN